MNKRSASPHSLNNTAESTPKRRRRRRSAKQSPSQEDLQLLVNNVLWTECSCKPQCSSKWSRGDVQNVISAMSEKSPIGKCISKSLLILEERISWAFLVMGNVFNAQNNTFTFHIGGKKHFFYLI